MKFSHSFRVSPDDIDEQGHVNNVAYLRWIQDVAVAHWRHAATPEMIEKYSWIVVRHEIDYKKQGFVHDEITASTWVGEWTKVTCERFTELCRADDVLVRGRTLWCMIDRGSSRPARISKSLIERFA
jgi:acyl-CoA thioester hydrolase